MIRFSKDLIISKSSSVFSSNVFTMLKQIVEDRSAHRANKLLSVVLLLPGARELLLLLSAGPSDDVWKPSKSRIKRWTLRLSICIGEPSIQTPLVPLLTTLCADFWATASELDMDSSVPTLNYPDQITVCQQKWMHATLFRAIDTDLLRFLRTPQECS